MQESLGYLSGYSCLEKAKDIFPGRVSVDIMFGLPGQTIDQWRTELNQIIAVCDKHVSLYQLTLELGTPMYKWVSSGQYKLPINDEIADMYDLAVEVLEKHNLRRYEVSNFSEPGYECRHNQAYWNGEDYIGVGPGAHGRLTPLLDAEKVVPVREERIQSLQPDNWMREVERLGHATRKVVPQTKMNRLKEFIMLSLRTSQGLSAKRWGQLCTEVDILTLFGNSELVNYMVNEDLLVLDTGGIRATSKGLAILDGITSNLLIVLEKELELLGILLD